MTEKEREQYQMYLASDAYLFHRMSPGGQSKAPKKPKKPKKPKG